MNTPSKVPFPWLRTFSTGPEERTGQSLRPGPPGTATCKCKIPSLHCFILLLYSSIIANLRSVDGARPSSPLSYTLLLSAFASASSILLNILASHFILRPGARIATSIDFNTTFPSSSQFKRPQYLVQYLVQRPIPSRGYHGPM